jgi:hypothetical protein
MDFVGDEVPQMIGTTGKLRPQSFHGGYATAIFFNLEKAYDTTWNYGMLQDQQNAGLKRPLANICL